MSESRKGGEPVRSEERGKNEMIKELKESGMYELGMSRDEMKECLTAIRLSQNTVKGGGGNNNDNKAPELMYQDNQPGHSRGFNSKNSERRSTSPELSGNQMRKSLSQEKRGESGDEFTFPPFNRINCGKEYKDFQPMNINKSHCLINDNFPEAMDNKQSGQRIKSLMRNNGKPKSTMNPLEVVINVKDVRLQPHYRTMPDKECAEGRNWVNIDEALPRVVEHLQKIASLWHNQQRSSVRSKIPWGKAIQVDTDNANEDTESVSDTTWPIAGPSGTNIYANNEKRRRACARKIIDYTSGEISGSNSDNDFEETSTTDKKKPIKRASSSEKSSLHKDVIENIRKRRNAVKKDDIYVWNEEQMSEKEEDEEDDEIKNVKRKKLTEEASSSEYTNLTEENVTSELTRIRRNISKKFDNSPWESIIDEVDEDDENYSDDESKKTGKKKKSTKTKPPAKKFTNTRMKRQETVEPSTSNEIERENDDAAVCIEDSDEMIIFDNEIISKTLQKTEKNRNEEAVSSTSSSYPRRIIPPNPKPKFSEIRARKPLLNHYEHKQREKQFEQHERVNEEDTLINHKIINTSETSLFEITDNLENDECTQVIPLPFDFEMKPLRISDRMKLQQERLKNVRKQEEQLEIQRAEERRIKEETAQRDKEMKIRMRLKEENEKIRLAEQIAKAKEQSEKRWNSLLNQQGKKRQIERIELNSEGSRRNSDASSMLMKQNEAEIGRQQIDAEVVDDDQRGCEQRVPCPICGKKFISKLIEDHAASCEEYDATTTPDASRSNSPVVSTRPATSMRRGNSDKLHECVVCSSYSSYDGRKFEDHVSKCVARHRDGVAAGPRAVIEVPDSPIRNLRKTSELIESEINYKQFVPKTKSQLNDNRKRKRL